MTNRSRAGVRQNPRGASATERAGVIREPIRGLHQGQQPCVAQTGRTHDCTRPASDIKIPLHRRARPHMRHRGCTPRPRGSSSRDNGVMIAIREIQKASELRRGRSVGPDLEGGEFEGLRDSSAGGRGLQGICVTVKCYRASVSFYARVP